MSEFQENICESTTLIDETKSDIIFWISEILKRFELHITFFFCLINLVNEKEKMLTAFNLSECKFLFFILDSPGLEIWNGMYLKIKTPLS